MVAAGVDAVGPLGLALRPGQRRLERVVQVAADERHDGRVVGAQHRDAHDLPDADAAEGGRHVEHPDAVPAGELADDHLEVVDRPSDQEEDDHVREQEGAAAVLERCEGEAPHVAQAHRHRDARHEELGALAPALAGRRRLGRRAVRRRHHLHIV